MTTITASNIAGRCTCGAPWRRFDFRPDDPLDPGRAKPSGSAVVGGPLLSPVVTCHRGHEFDVLRFDAGLNKETVIEVGRQR